MDFIMIIFVINILSHCCRFLHERMVSDHDIDQAKGCTSVYMRHLHEKVLTFKQIFVNKYTTIYRNNLNKIYPCFNEIYDIFLMNVSYCDIKSFYYYLEIILKLLYIIS